MDMPTLTYRNWLIRRDEPGRRRRYWSVDGAGCRWTFSVEEALCFARKSDAQRLIDFWGWHGVAEPYRAELARLEMVP